VNRGKWKVDEDGKVVEVLRPEPVEAGDDLDIQVVDIPQRVTINPGGYL